MFEAKGQDKTWHFMINPCLMKYLEGMSLYNLEGSADET
jgi:hypothetical protein